MPERVELRRKTGQRGSLIARYRRLKKRHRHNSCGGGSPCPCTLGAARVPASQAAAHAQLSLGQSCHRQKNSCVYACRVASVVSNSLQPCRLWPARLLCQGRRFSRQEYCRVLANTSYHTLLEHCISYSISANSPEYLALPEPLQPKQLHHLHTWPSQGQTQVLQGSLRSKPQWTTHMQRWK